MKLLSIVVPSYNVEKTLGATLKSLCCEDLIEKLDIIVVDDGSKDSTDAIAERFTTKYPKSVRLIKKENGGHGSTVNRGIVEAVGKYFKVVDGDDKLDHDALKALLQLLEKTDADLVASNYRKVLEDGTNAGDMDFHGVEFGKLYNFSELPVDGSLYFGIHSSTFKTAILKEHNITLQEHTFYVDTEYALLPIPYVKTVVFLNKQVYLYTVGSSGQSIDPKNFVKRYDHHLRVVKRLVEFAGNVKTDKSHADYIYSVLSKLVFTQYMLAAFYDDDIKRGRTRAREFDAILKNNERLYNDLASSFYIKVLRRTNFRFLIKGEKLKNIGRKAFSVIKKLTGKKKLTY